MTDARSWSYQCGLALHLHTRAFRKALHQPVGEFAPESSLIVSRPKSDSVSRMPLSGPAPCTRQAMTCLCHTHVTHTRHAHVACPARDPDKIAGVMHERMDVHRASATLDTSVQESACSRACSASRCASALWQQTSRSAYWPSSRCSCHKPSIRTRATLHP
jgi:hypothetical protein